MTKCVLDVGNCGPDHSSIRAMLISKYGVSVLQADQTTDAISTLEKNDVDLILVNRKLDVDYTDGLDVIKAIKANDQFAKIPVMLITNLDEHQETAVAVGAIPGFGKLALNAPATQERLAAVLG